MSEEFSHLKKGDKVIVCYGGCGSIESIKEVVNITPTGLIKVDDMLFYTTGSERTSNIWNHAYLKIATEDAIEKIHQREIIWETYRVLELTKLTYEQAVAILNIIKGK